MAWLAVLMGVFGLLSLVGPPLTVLVDAVSFVISGLLLWRVRVVEPSFQRPSVRGILAAAPEGLRWVYRHPSLRPLALGGHGWFLSSAVAAAVGLSRFRDARIPDGG